MIARRALWDKPKAPAGDIGLGVTRVVDAR
jgi:hypothetical protein